MRFIYCVESLVATWLPLIDGAFCLFDLTLALGTQIVIMAFWLGFASVSEHKIIEMRLVLEIGRIRRIHLHAAVINLLFAVSLICWKLIIVHFTSRFYEWKFDRMCPNTWISISSMLLFRKMAHWIDRMRWSTSAKIISDNVSWFSSQLLGRPCLNSVMRELCIKIWMLRLLTRC